MAKIDDELSRAEAMARAFCTDMDNAAGLFAELGAEGVLASLDPALIIGANLDIVPPGADLGARQAAAHDRLAGGLGAYQALLTWLSTPAPALGNQIPLALIRRMAR